MPTLHDAEVAALALLGDTVDDPTPRARRIAAVYAACYLDEPFVGSWFGLASYVSRQVYYALEGPALVWRDLMGDGNRAIYVGVVPSWLLWRAGHAVPGPLSAVFDQLRRADVAMRHRTPAGGAGGLVGGAEAMAEAGLAALCDVEQREFLQPTFDKLPAEYREPLRQAFRFRLGLSPTAPVLAWDNVYGGPWQLDARRAWLTAEVLPVWQEARAEHGMLVRSEADRTRRWGGVTQAALDAAVGSLG